MEGESGDALVIFRIPHKRPHGLKRPLQQCDSLTGMDFAVRMYSIAECDGDALRVVRCPSADIVLMELISNTVVSEESMLSELKQWTVRPEVEFNKGPRVRRGDVGQLAFVVLRCCCRLLPASTQVLG